MLATPYRGDIEQAIHDERWFFEQKLDGERVITHITEDGIEAWSRTGFEIEMSSAVHKELREVFEKEEWTLDGEYLNNVYHIFDLPKIASCDATGIAYVERKNALLKIFEKIQNTSPVENIGAVRAARTPEEKQILYNRTLEGRLEGVLIKRVDSIYEPGKRSKRWLKVKNTETADCVVMETGRGNTGRAVTIGMYNNGQLQEVGGCKISKDDLLDRVEVGTVLEIKYLYATADDHLYLPVFSRIREDKTAKQCTLEGLKYPDKSTVIDLTEE